MALCSGDRKMLFILLPFIVIGMVLVYRGEFGSIFYMPEWSLASSVLFGQAIARFAGAAAEGTRGERVSLTIAVLIVVCLVPSLVILSMALLGNPVTTRLAVAQMVLFAVALFCGFLAAVIAKITFKKL